MPLLAELTFKFEREFHPDRGYLYERTEYDPLERALADEWEQVNKSGVYTLEKICGRSVSSGERYAAASVIQWLGTNCGFSFLNSCFQNAGFTIHGWTPSRRYSTAEDPLLHEMEEVVYRDEWEKAFTDRAQAARQLAFDLSEAT